MNIIKITLFFVGLTFGSPLLAKLERIDKNQPVSYYADSQTYDRELGILILKGHVEFEHQGDVLEADYVTYNENSDIVTASGNVRLRQQNGDVEFGEYMELTGDMKDGVILQLRTLLADDSKIAALEGRKSEGKEELDQAVYTPCALCGDKPPTWQINARRAVKDNETNDIHFTDAHMRILDFPILYMPYATQPLERRSGFLIPRLDYSTAFGANIEIPYYIVLSEDKDMTISPVFFTQQNPLLMSEYRQTFGNGIWTTNGSITNYKLSEKDKKAKEKAKNKAGNKKGGYEIPRNRGHILTEGKFTFNDVWRGGFSGGYVSDKTYFRKYGFSGWKNESNLTSKAIVEGFLNQRDYAAAKVYHFQGLKESDQQRKIASALPYLEYNGYSAVDPLGGRFSYKGNMLNLYREKGINMQRGIGFVDWRRPWIALMGQEFTFYSSLRGDLYEVEHGKTVLVKKGRRQETLHKDGGGRVFPQTGLNWKWPFIATCQQQSYIIQPVSELILGPSRPLGVKSRKIPNEDSADFELNDVNIFSWDRFPGYDLIDTGSRVVYGGEVLTTGKLFGDVDVFLGQSYAMSKPKTFERTQGFGRRPSDYVGRVELNPLPWIKLNYRFRLDEKSLHQRVSEVGGSLGLYYATLSGDYVFLSKHTGTPDKKDLNQLSLTLSSKITDAWEVVATARQNLKKKKDGGGPLSRGVGLIYRDDCFGLGFTVRKDYYKARDVRPNTVYLVTLFLKNIGDFNYSFNLDKGLFGERTTQEDTN